MERLIKFRAKMTDEIINVIDVIRVNKYASAQDIRQFAENGISINSYLLDYYNKVYGGKMNIEELFAIIRDKKVTYNDIIKAFKDKGYKNIELSTTHELKTRGLAKAQVD